MKEFVKKTLLDKPDDFWNLDKLRELYRTDREPTLREIIQVVFGISPGIATREQLAAEEFERFLATENVDSTKVRELRQIFMAVLLDSRVRENIEAGQFGKIMSVDMGVYQGLKQLGKTGLQQLMAYVEEHVRLSDFKRAAIIYQFQSSRHQRC